MPLQTNPRRRLHASQWEDDIVWLLPALAAGVTVYALYLLSHPYPAYGAGLFFLMAEQVSQHGYRLPATIPYYAEPVPFAYPPLMFYVMALLGDATGWSHLAISRFLPGLVTTAYLVPFYLFVRELVGSNRQAGVAAFVLALSPPVLQWHLSAGGIVRAPAALFLISGLYTGLKLFRTRRPRWLLTSVGLFALTVLTHPSYTMFFGLSYLWLYLALDRTPAGLLDGAVVAVGGLVVAAPWWVPVAATHGVAVFTGAAGTHGGITGRLPELAIALFPELSEPLSSGHRPPVRWAELLGIRTTLVNLSAVGLLMLVAWLGLIIGAAASLVTVDELRSSRTVVFLVGWLVLSLVVAQPRFVFLVGAIVGVVAIYEYLLPLGTRLGSGRVERRHLELGVLLVVGVSGLLVGGLYAGGHLDSDAGSPSLPAFIDDDDLEAMAWVAANTDRDDRFVVMGDAAEWFPLYTRRGILVGPWGVEWSGNDAYNEQLQQYIQLSTCSSEPCLSMALQQTDRPPDYVYVPAGEYTVRGMETTSSAELRAGLVRSPAYTLVYQNDGVLVFEYVGEPERPLPEDRRVPP